MKEELNFGPFRFLPAARILYEGDRRLKVSSRAIEILLALIERPGDLISQRAIASRVWPGLHVDDGALRVHVSALRKALGDDPAAPRYIFNVVGQGYRFVAPTPTLVAQEQDACNEAPTPISTAACRTIGREATNRQVMASLQRSRFVTITGPGGIGKTTVALAVATELASGYAQGKIFVDLSSLSDPQLLPSSLASALGLQLRSSDPNAELIAWFAKQKMLLVLDSCEHLIDATASLGERIMAAAPDVHLLTTSREPLRAAGEWVTRLPPLELPIRCDNADPSEALKSPAILLFVKRACAADDTFAFSDENAVAIIEICRRLDGIPLAIEFAAARIGAFGANELLARLDDSFAVLRSGRRTAVPRHRTLRATLDWSHDLLSPLEQILFRQLAAFKGSFTLDAIQMTVSMPEDQAGALLDGVANLVAKSLLNANSKNGEIYYRFLETTRAYAAERLMQSGDAAGLAHRIANYLNALFEKIERDWEFLSTPGWNRPYAHLIDDVRAGLEWALSTLGDTLLGAALTVSSSPLWFSMGLVAEYRVRADRALQSIASAKVDAPALEMRLNVLFASALFNTDGPLSGRASAYGRALAIATRLMDSEYQLRSLWGLAGQKYLEGDYNQALNLCRRFDAVVEASDDSAAKLVRDRMMALGLHLVGRQDDARRYAERALTHPAALMRNTHKSFQEYDSRVASRSHLARILWVQGFPDRAVEVAQEGVDCARLLDYAPPLCYILAFAACPIAIWTGDLAAARLYVDMIRDPAANISFDYWRSWHFIYDVAVSLAVEASPDILLGALGGLGEVAKRPVYGDILATLRNEFAGPAAFARAADNSAGWCAPEILRAQSIAVLRKGGKLSGGQAKSLLLQSLEISRRQGALSWELRTATSLAELYQRGGDNEAARATLGPVYARFTEGFGTSDLKNAATLLQELNA